MTIIKSRTPTIDHQGLVHLVNVQVTWYSPNMTDSRCKLVVHLVCSAHNLLYIHIWVLFITNRYCHVINICIFTIEVYEFESRSGEVYSIQHYVIKFVSDLRQAGSFPADTLVSSTNKTDYHDITAILLKVALNNLTLTSLQPYHIGLDFFKSFILI